MKCQSPSLTLTATSKQEDKFRLDFDLICRHDSTDKRVCKIHVAMVIHLLFFLNIALFMFPSCDG